MAAMADTLLRLLLRYLQKIPTLTSSFEIEKINRAHTHTPHRTETYQIKITKERWEKRAHTHKVTTVKCEMKSSVSLFKIKTIIF